MIMNISITKEYLRKVLGNQTLDQFLTVSSFNTAIVKYFLPWIAAIVVVTNLLVCFLCLGIYLKTKRRNHKPAFVFIGFLALIDVVIGM